MITAKPAILKKLEMMKSQSLKLISGTVESIPLDSVEVLSIIKPLKIKREEMAQFCIES
jgi:hypothetical protein